MTYELFLFVLGISVDGLEHVFSCLEQSRNSRTNFVDTFVHHSFRQPSALGTADMEFVELDSMLLDIQQYSSLGPTDTTVPDIETTQCWTETLQHFSHELSINSRSVRWSSPRGKREINLAKGLNSVSI